LPEREKDMKIYVLLRQDYEGSQTVCVSEDINKIRISICEDLDVMKIIQSLKSGKMGSKFMQHLGVMY